MGDETSRESLLNSDKNFALLRCVSHAYDELHSFRRWLKWLCVDQSNAKTACLSWFVFLVFAILIPALSHFVLACSDCDNRHSRPYDTVMQLSLSGVAALSFICLSFFIRKFGLRRFLFFDKLYNESETVRKGYTEQLNVCICLNFVSLNCLSNVYFSNLFFSSELGKLIILYMYFLWARVVCGDWMVVSRRFRWCPPAPRQK